MSSQMSYHERKMVGLYVRTFRTSFLLIILASTFQSLSAFQNSRDVPFTEEKIQLHSNNAQLDRRRRESLPQQQVSHFEDTEIGSTIHVVSGSDSGDRFSQIEPENPRFSVDERTGNIKLMESLDYETSPEEIINVEITSINNPEKFDTVQVIVDVMDVAEPPEWQMLAFPYKGVVPTDAPSGASIYQLRAKDPDGDGQNEVRYHLKSGGEGMFIVNEETGWILTKLDSGESFVDEKEYVLSVYAVDITDGNEETSTGNAAIHIYGGTIPPQFVKEEYHAKVVENKQPQQVIQVTAFSFKRNQGVQYQIIGPTQRPTHTISQDGIITLAEAIDRERMDTYILEVEAREPITGGETTTVKVYVEVEDINDCTPDFGQSTFIIRDIAEDIAPNEQIGSVSATDCDKGKNGAVTYTSSGRDASLFRLLEDGTIYTQEPLDYEATPDHSYIFAIEAKDSGSPSRSSMATVVIVISNVNDLGPVFQPVEYEYYVDETAPQDYSIGTVYASDADGDRITYEIYSGNDGNHFQINPTTGVIFRNTEGSVNLPKAMYVLNITAEDDGRCCSATTGRGDTSADQIHRSFATVMVIVNDINDNVPVFTACGSYNPSIPENANEGRPVIQVSASDEDRGANAEITYGIETNENAILPFTITPSKGEIKISGRLDREAKSSYEISVTATDRGKNPLIGFCRFTITVTDINDNAPKFAFSEYRASLASNAPSQTVFLTIKAEDADETSNIEYTTLFENGDQSRYFALLNGELITRRSVSLLSGTTQEFFVEAKEGDRSVLATVRVTISDSSNSAPAWENAPFPVITIREDTPVGMIIKTVTAISTVEDNRVTYAIVQGQRPLTNNPKIFDLENAANQRDGEVKVFDILDYETTPSFELTLQAESSGSFTLSNFITLRVNLEDVNDNRPKFTKSVYQTAVPEERPAGTTVIRVEAIDRDVSPAFNRVVYSIKEQTGSDDWRHFEIDENTGEITTTRRFDWEDKNYFLIEVEATDGMESHTAAMTQPANYINEPPDQATIQIRIVDVNDNEPQFDRTLYPVDVAENQAVGTVIETVTAVDLDKGIACPLQVEGLPTVVPFTSEFGRKHPCQSNLRYLIRGNQGGAFRADPINGQISIAAPLDFETLRTYTLKYSANDGLHVANTRIEITVNNVNDERPEFADDKYEAMVNENDNNAKSYFNGKVSADDGDDGDNIVYSLEGVDDDIFDINPDTGEISLLQPLDREEEDEWNFLVKATDEGGMEGFAEVVVVVNNENDNPPILDPEYTGSIPEDAEAGDSVMTIMADDADDGLLEYSVVPRPSDPMDGADKFRIDPDTGEITVKKPIDREEVPEYHLQIEVTDGQNMATTTAIIKVEDVNDNSPSFIGGPYEVDAPETLAVGETVLEVTASDPDEDFKDDVVFSINGGNGDGLFEIVTDNINLVGIIKVAKPLDFETQSQLHTLNLLVSDGVNPSDSTTAAISILDISDEPPMFDEDQYEATIPEDTAVGDEVIRVTASDPESGPAGDFKYDILDESNPDGLFDINPDTGAVTVAKDLDRETVEEHELVLLAVDRGDPPQTGTATLVVTLSDVADADPYFLPYVAETPESTPPPQQVVTLTAADDDIGSNRGGPPFTYRLLNSDFIEQFFSYDVNADNTVTISTKAEFDREEQENYGMIFEITETRNGNTGVGTSTVTISITDVNDNPHKGTTKEMLVYAYEGSIPESSIGYVGVIDPDTIEDKTYIPKPNDDYKQFEVDEDTGEVTIKANTPGGTYTFKVTVKDDGRYPDVVSTVRVNVKDISTEAVQSSGSFRFEDVTAEEFIAKPDPDKPSKQEVLLDILVDILPAKKENIDIFSIINVPGMERTIDVRYTAHGSPVYPASQMNAAALANMDRLAAALGVTIGQIPVDECIHEYVCESSCTNVIVVDPTPTVINTPTQSLAAISSRVVPQCVCGAKMAQAGPCVAGLTCINGGTCTNTEGGHTCECRSGYDGPDCQQTKRSFKDGFAFFDTLQQCLETHTSLEFITTSPDGTLLYNGPMADPIKDDDPTDFILIELIGGKPVLMLDLGSGIEKFDMHGSPRLDDGEWHRLDVFRNGKDVEFMVDLCKTATVSEDHSSSSADTSSCKVTGRTPNDNSDPNNHRFLNVNTPLQLGGVDTSSEFKYPAGLSFVGGFDGCLRNVDQDGKIYDLAKTGRSQNSDAGCSRTDKNCFGDNGEPICKNGVCIANLRGAYCICDPGYMGEFCDMETPAFDFPKDSFVNYELKEDNNGLGQLDERSGNYQIMFGLECQMASCGRSPIEMDLNLLHWRMAKRQVAWQYDTSITLTQGLESRLIDGTLRGRWNLGDGEIIAHLNGTRLDDGEWHVVQFERTDNYVVIKVDGGGGVKQYESRESQFLTLDVDPNSLMVGAFVVRAVDISQDFQGCMNDPRINDNYLGFDGENDFAIGTPSTSISEGCPSMACIGDPCPPTYICDDIWRLHVCVCPAGQMDTGISCVDFNECEADPHPCQHGGKCFNEVPGYRCDCPKGYKGEDCQVLPPDTIVTPPLVFAWEGYLIIILCLLLILILLLIFFVYKRNRDHKQALIFSVAPEDDIRENYVNYDEEGGGEEDETGYNLPTISIPLVETPSSKNSIRSDTNLLKPQEELPNYAAAPPPVQGRSPNDPSVKDFIDDRLWNANNDQNAPPYDTLFFFKYEGTGSQAGSLSSLDSSNPDEDQDYFYLNNWGPQFKKLADIYGDAGGED
ncbi:LOW QUALITY PROTEIN: neural-cadherin-like [Amphiura filiformis]|uniref:LOW QUALITY PROTEIN: neural-cadherin-like n=1 Tax=Amphiura filiformis TaxID=82378 RepID=UPI003B210634